MVSGELERPVQRWPSLDDGWSARIAIPGVGCVVADAVAPLLSAAYDRASKALPNPQEIIPIGKPNTTDRIDVWGTVWSPQFGKGGRIWGMAVRATRALLLP